MRIIAGEKRGHTIVAPEGMNTRPTQDRVREAIFGMFQFYMPGSRVLDLFAGSGAMGLEALSRGAAFALFNDASIESIGMIRTNIARLGYADKSQIFNYDCIAAIERLTRAGEKFDFVFVDPPYRAGVYKDVLKLLSENGLMRRDGRIVVERANEIGLSPVAGLTLTRQKRYGRTTIEVYQ